MKKLIKYNDLLDITKIQSCYYIIKNNTKHRDKIVNYELFITSNLVSILSSLKDKTYTHGKYNVFLVTRPKHRIIMSENLRDKIVNHLVARFALYPYLEPKLLEVNVATRPNKGTKAAIYYMKKYLNSMKQKYDNFYILKCDISKYFYSIDHTILLDKLKKIIKDNDILNLLEEIIESTNRPYVNLDIDKCIKREKEKIKISKINENEKKELYNILDNIPRYLYKKGLPIGNMTSQILAIFYLNDLDHFIKEKLRIKYYIRFMDDFVLIHEDKDYLKYCKGEINKELNKLKLKLNKKTEIINISKGITFLGFKYIISGNRLNIIISNNVKRRINKYMRNIDKDKRYNYLIEKYNGYFCLLGSHAYVDKHKNSG